MKRYRVGILGATGMVGQRFVTLLKEHPWFSISVVAASSRSAGKTYEEAVQKKWVMEVPIPKDVKSLVIKDAVEDIKEICDEVDFVFCAVDMSKEDIRSLEESYAKMDCPVISNNSAHRFTPDVPMVIPEINPEHIKIIESQRKRLGVKRGFIAVKSNCSLQCYVPAVHPLMSLGVKNILACTYQAVSGAGKTLDSWTDMNDNIIPFIKGEEEKSEKEPLKIWGRIEGEKIVNADFPNITSQCIRVPVSNGHMAAVFVSFENKPDVDNIIKIWENYEGLPQRMKLPFAPKNFLHYFKDVDRPQIKLDRELEGGMAVSVGRLREDSQYDIKFICMSHNTIRGAAGGAILMAELLCHEGYII